MIFILRHIQLIVLLTHKDEKSWEKFHARHVFFGVGFAGPGSAAKSGSFAQIPAKIAGEGMVQIGLQVVICVEQFDARREGRVIRNEVRQCFFEIPGRTEIPESAKF